MQRLFCFTAILAGLICSATPSNGHTVECLWQNAGLTHSDVVIEHMGPYDTSYSTLHRETGWGTNYCQFISYADRGKRHNYRAYRDDGMSQSEALTDFVFPPYRNTSAAYSGIYVKKIEYSGWIEGWLQGDAEFDIIAVYCNRGDNTVRADSLFVRTPTGANLSGKLLKQWYFTDSEKDWYSLVDIYMYEKDPGGTYNYSLSGSIGIKLSDMITFELKGTYTHKGQRQDNVCGNVRLMYYENPNQTLVFPNYSVRLTIADSD